MIFPATKMANVMKFVQFLIIIFQFININVLGNSGFSYDHALTTTEPTNGHPWPLPASIKTTNQQSSLDPDTFTFVATRNTCDTLTEAFHRYRFLTFPILSRFQNNHDLRFKSNYRDVNKLLPNLVVVIKTPCTKYPSFQSVESYSLTISSGRGVLQAETVWGGLRGLETFSQIVHQNAVGEYVVNGTKIKDTPRFAYRATMLDTSRHFLNMDVIKQNLDAMAQNKFNVFHWHIVDSTSFPYESYTFPQLSIKGAYSPSHVYTQTDVKEVIEYARLRGIRVIPEFDTPGHSLSWGPGQPKLLTPCYKGSKPSGQCGPINPILNSTYAFLDRFITEWADVFPDKYFHMGGDEVSFSCWKSNPDIQSFMKKMKFGDNYALLEQYYMQRLLKIVKNKTRGYIIWQEVVDNKAKVAADTVVDVWKGGYKAELAYVTGLGYRTVLSSCWYLNYISYGIDWPKYYKCDPHDFKGSAAQKKLVIGGQTCMWGEYVDSTNLMSRFWPRASAVAERLWSPASVNNVALASPRLHEHRCRMLRRGLNVEPVTGPGFCARGVKP